jgi:spermidine/putrescine transport system permease protein
MRKFTILFFLMLSLVVCAQSKTYHDLRVAASTTNALLDTFPETYASKKINISLFNGKYALLDSNNQLDTFDILFAHTYFPQATTWGDSIYSYTDSEGIRWTIWQNKKEIKNSQMAVRANNAKKAMLTYITSNTRQESHAIAWVGWIMAALLSIAGILYALSTWRARKAEANLPSAEQERLRRKRSANRRHLGSQLYLWLLLLVLYSPIALIVVFSFTESKILGNWTGFSFELYLNLFSGEADAGLNNAITHTLLIALIAAICSTILGTLAAIGIYNMRAKQRKAVSFLNSVPMINPDIITGISLFLLFVALGISQGLATVCIAHIVFCTPYVVLSVLPRLSRMNPNTYEAALDLGATPIQALRMVMLPELWPGMLSGFILALTLSVDDFGVTFFTKGSGGLETLSTFIYSDARKGGLTPELRPLFTIILLVMLTVLVFINLRERKIKKEE